VREGLHKIVSSEETIVAISTALGHSAIGVIRVSGAQSIAVARKFFRPHATGAEFKHRMAVVGKWVDSDSRNEIDEVIMTPFYEPHSYTGEDLIEVTAHGNPIVLRRIVETIRTIGVRLATPGEFTMRAVAHCKMDLVQAEAVRDFIEAQTEQQARIALTQMDGALSKRIQPLKSRLIEIIARLEAGIDFAENDVDVPTNEALIAGLRPICEELSGLASSFDYGKVLSKGIKLAILGKPNVGKSSLFNRLVCSDRSIVTDVPGTTRDVVMETVRVQGVPLCFADTAGIRKTTDRIETLGVTRTFETLADSDYAIVVLDGSKTLDADDRWVLEKAGCIPHLIAINKADMPQTIEVHLLNAVPQVSVSAKTGQGVDVLEQEVRAGVLARGASFADELVLTTARQHEAVTRCAIASNAACKALAADVPHEMVLLDLYQALTALNELTGEVVTEDILNQIFSTFCVGK
jgi:tRNA modification GTPase